jgi:hypothetical protein
MAYGYTPAMNAILQDTANRFAYLRSLGLDWDSYGGDPPTARAIDSKRHLLEIALERFADVPADRLRPFAISPTPSGGILIEWRSPGFETAVDVDQEGSLHFLFVEGESPPYRYQEEDKVPVERVLELIGRSLHGATQA